MKANSIYYVRLGLICVGLFVSELGALQCPRVVDLKHHSLIVECTAPDGSVSPCTSEMPIGTTLKYYCDKQLHFRMRSHQEQNQFEVICDNYSRWTNYEHLKEFQCVQECGSTAPDSPRPWELHIKNKKHPRAPPCMGTLIPILSSKHRSFIITSRKCVSQPNNGPPYSPAELVVTIPKRPYSEVPEFQVKRVYFPPSDENIALVRLENKIEITPSVKPICLPFDLTPQMNDSMNPLIEHGQVVGFGNSTHVSKVHCRIFDLPQIDMTEMEFCADRNSPDGPYVTHEPAVYDAHQTVSTLRGIFASALTRDTCKSGFLFTSVATPSVIQWIRETVHKEDDSTEYKYIAPRSPVVPSHHHHHSHGPQPPRPTRVSSTTPIYTNPDVYPSRQTSTHGNHISRYTTLRDYSVSSPSTETPYFQQAIQIDRRTTTREISSITSPYHESDYTSSQVTRRQSTTRSSY